MLREPHLWMERIKSIQRDHTTTRLALARLTNDALRDSSVLVGDLKVQDIARASERLEGTYLIRLFAEFEMGLRIYWATIRETEPPTQHLLDSIGARRRIPVQQLADAQAVRDYRNSLVHERDEKIAPISIADASQALCRFLAFLPLNW